MLLRASCFFLFLEPDLHLKSLACVYEGQEWNGEVAKDSRTEQLYLALILKLYMQFIHTYSLYPLSVYFVLYRSNAYVEVCEYGV